MKGRLRGETGEKLKSLSMCQDGSEVVLCESTTSELIQEIGMEMSKGISDVCYKLSLKTVIKKYT